MEAGDREAGISELESLCGQSEYLPLRLRLGASLLRSGRSEEANRIFTAAVESRPGSFHAQLGLGQARQAQGRWSEALSAYEFAREIDEDVATLFSLLSEVYQELGQVELSQEARAAIYWKGPFKEFTDPWRNEVVVTDGYDAYQLMVVSEIAEEAGDTALREAALQRVGEVDPNYPAYLLERSLESRRDGDLSGAISYLEKAVQAPSLDESSICELIDCYLADDRIEEATTLAEKIVSILPLSSNLQLMLGKSLAASGNVSEALVRYDRAYELNPRGLPQTRVLGEALLASDWTRGTSLLAQYLQRQPGDIDTAISVGKQSLERGEGVLATVLLKPSYEASAVPPPPLRIVYASALATVGSQMADGGDYESARKQFESSLLVWPDNPEALANLGVCLVQLNEKEAALKALQAFTRLKPESSFGWLTLGKAQLVGGYRKEAIDSWERGIRVARRNGEAAIYRELSQLLSRFTSVP